MADVDARSFRKVITDGNSGARNLPSVISFRKHPDAETPQGRPSKWPPLRCLYVRRRPSLPHDLPCSTIGAERLNFRVRNGAGCFPLAMITETLKRFSGAVLQLSASRPYLGSLTVDAYI